MNASTVLFELSETLDHLQTLLAQLREEKISTDDEPALAVQLGHILDHVSLAWNCKDMSLEKIGSLSQIEFERLSNTVPNFLGERSIGEVAPAGLEI